MERKPKTNPRNAYLKRTYGITLEQYEAMLTLTNGGCWICGKPPKPGKHLNVDHEHPTKAQRKAGVVFGKVRGLLCWFCNRYVIGRSKADVVWRYRKAAEYLESKIDWRTHAV